MRNKHLIIRALLVLVVIFVLSVLATSWYMVHTALTPNGPQRDMLWTDSMMAARYPTEHNWQRDLYKEHRLLDTLITDQEGNRLHAFYIPADSATNKTAIVVHGYTANAMRVMHIAYLYGHQLGYNVLLPELEYHGASEGDAIQMGWDDRIDILQWMEVANNLWGGHTDMVVHGISMGAATTMMVSGEKTPDYVKCFVEDCGYTSVWDEFAGELQTKYSLPTFPVLNIASLISQIRYGWSFQQASALKQVAKCNKPMLFIHGDKDTYVPTWMVHTLYTAKRGAKELWIVPGATHAFAYKTAPLKYTNKVKDFVDTYNQ